MNAIALDLGTKTGWAACIEDVITSGTESFANNRFSGGGMRYLRFRNWLCEVLATVRPDCVFYEEVRRHMSTDAAHVYGGFMAQLTAICEERKIPYESIPVGTIKKHATGKGNANKDQMVEAAKRRWPDRAICDDNEADALWILDCGLVQEGPGR